MRVLPRAAQASFFISCAIAYLLKDPLIALTIAKLPALLKSTARSRILRRLLLVLFDEFFEGGGIAVGCGECGITTSRGRCTMHAVGMCSEVN